MRTWDLAHTFGHLSFKHLAMAEKVSINCKELKIKNRAITDRIHADLKLLSDIDNHEKQYFESLSSVIVFFQIMMEAIINDAPSHSPDLKKFSNNNFADKWIKSLSHYSIDLHNINEYVSVVYRPCRVTIVHPTQVKLNNDKFKAMNIENFELIKNALRSDWRSYADLSAALGLNHFWQEGHTESWQTMCAVNGVNA